MCNLLMKSITRVRKHQSQCTYKLPGIQPCVSSSHHSSWLLVEPSVQLHQCQKVATARHHPNHQYHHHHQQQHQAITRHHIIASLTKPVLFSSTLPTIPSVIATLQFVILIDRGTQHVKSRVITNNNKSCFTLKPSCSIFAAQLTCSVRSLIFNICKAY